MKEIDYLAEYARMCESYDVCCWGCPLNDPDSACFKTILNDLPAAKTKIAAWSEAHPQKTYAQDFFSKFPNAPKYDSGYPHGCVRDVYGKDVCPCTICYECWNRPMP